jgi:hypothetical protein
VRQLAKLHASGTNYRGHVLAHARNWPRGLLSNTTQALPAVGVILFEANARDVPPAVTLAVLFHPLVHGLFKLRSRSCLAGPGTCSDVRSGSFSTGWGKLQVQQCPQCPVSDGRPEKGGLS